MNKILFGLLLCSLFSSCIVPKKKYDTLLAQKIQTDADRSDRATALDKANADIKDLNDELARLKEDTTNRDLMQQQQPLAIQQNLEQTRNGNHHHPQSRRTFKILESN